MHPVCLFKLFSLYPSSLSLSLCAGSLSTNMSKVSGWGDLSNKLRPANNFYVPAGILSSLASSTCVIINPSSDEKK
jgi:hypothetical protein